MNKTKAFIEGIMWVMLFVGSVLICAPFSPFMYWQIVLTFLPPVQIGNSSTYFYPEYRGTFLFCGLCLIVGTCLLGDAINRIWGYPMPLTKNHICLNEDCLKDFEETDCKALLYCSIDCCKQNFIKEEGSLDNFSGCERCLA
jgi:hypothetical protein